MLPLVVEYAMTNWTTGQELHLDYIDTYSSPIGELTISCDGESLTGLWLDSQKYFMEHVTEAEARSDLPVLLEARAWLDCYFAGKDPGFLPAVKPVGTAFREQVWKLLVEIPYGQVTTYGELARRIAASTGVAKMSSRAVGGAVGHNPISIIIPCHRVIGSNGSLTGFGGGIARKIQLLELEGIDTGRYRIPTRGIAL